MKSVSRQVAKNVSLEAFGKGPGRGDRKVGTLWFLKSEPREPVAGKGLSSHLLQFPFPANHEESEVERG